MVVLLITEKLFALEPPKLTHLTPVKSVPVIVIVESVEPEVGEKDVMVGGGKYVNPAKLPVPALVVTFTLPLKAFAGTKAVILVLLLTIKEDAATPPKFTAVAPVKLLPVITTESPIAALVGVKAVIKGAVTNPPFQTEPPGVVTSINPLVAFVGTTAVILLELTTVKEVAAIPPKLTTVAPVKFVPVIVTVVPPFAVVGVKEVIVGQFDFAI